jgi:hypothetical protein
MTPLGWLGLANGVLTVLLLLIAVVACVTPDPDVTALPSECPPGLPIGCSRVAVLNSHRTGGVEPLEVRGVELELVTNAFQSTAEKAGGRLLYRGAIADGSAGEFQHYRFISTLFGFPDDLFAQVSLTAEVCKGRCFLLVSLIFSILLLQVWESIIFPRPLNKFVYKTRQRRRIKPINNIFK